MFLIIANVVSEEAVLEARSVLDASIFKDGRATAGWHAREVKRNLQTGRGDEPVQKLRAELTKHIEQNALFRMFARPRKLTPLILSRYEVGMEYGTHVDDAIISGLRTDLSFTLFLEDPDSYDGGAMLLLGPLRAAADGAAGVRPPVPLVRRARRRRSGLGRDHVQQEPRPAARGRGGAQVPGGACWPIRR